MTTVEIEVTNEDVALEVGYALLGRAQDIHDNPDDKFEWVAEELKSLGHDVRAEYE